MPAVNPKLTLFNFISNSCEEISLFNSIHVTEATHDNVKKHI